MEQSILEVPKSHSKFKLGKNLRDGSPFDLNLVTLIATRMLLEGNSGSGKSYAIRRICEVTHGHVQQILIDMEGEFSSLREQFGYLLIGKNADRTADVNTADVLARRLLELNVSAIIDLSDLRLHERIRYVKLFLESLMDAPRELWHPALIIIDESHVFCPESGSAESSEAVISLATQGRKRGFSAMMATQRISQLSKAALAQMNNVLIGHTWLNNDKQRCAEVLGFTSKEQTNTLRDLEPGQFYAFGPAFPPGVELIQIDPVQTKHPEPGEQMPKIPPITDQMKKELSKLDDIPEIKKRELKEKEDFIAEIRSLRGQLAAAKRPDAVDPAKLNQVKEQAFAQGQRETEKQYASKLKEIESVSLHYKKILQDISVKSAEAARVEVPKFEPIPIRGISMPPSQIPRVPYPLTPPKPASRALDDDPEDERPPKKGVMRMLKAAAQFQAVGRDISKVQMGTVSGFSSASGTFSDYLSQLKRRGWIVDGNYGNLRITEEGLAAAGDVDPLPTEREQLVQLWKGKFKAGVGRMLQVLADRYPEWMTKEQLGQESGFSHTSGTFSDYLSQLARNSLAEKNGDSVRASPALFLEDE